MYPNHRPHIHVTEEQLQTMRSAPASIKGVALGAIIGSALFGPLGFITSAIVGGFLGNEVDEYNRRKK